MKHNKMKTPIVLAVAVLSVWLSTPARAQRQWTLDECTDYAIAHNTDMKHLLNEQKQREINAQASKDARLPRVSGDVSDYISTLRHSSGGTKFNANGALLNLGLAAAVPLYTGNRLSSLIQADKYALMAAGENVRSAEKDLRVQVAAAYLQVLYNKGDAAIARQRQEVSLLLEKRARSLFEKGQRPESEVAETSAMVSRDKALLTAAEGNIAMAMLDLRLLLNMPDSVDFDICDPSDALESIPLLQSYSAYVQTTSTHPAVQSAQYSILQAEQGVKNARSHYYPTLSLVGGLGTFWLNLNAEASHSGQIPVIAPWGLFKSFNINYHYGIESEWKWKNFFQAVVGLKLAVPIFNGFETRARIRSAKVRLEDAKVAYDDAQLTVHKKIRQAWQQAVTARERYEAEVKAEQSSELAYSYAQKRYEAGMATIFDLSQSRQQWFSASENALRMKYEYLIRKRILEILSRPY